MCPPGAYNGEAEEARRTLGSTRKRRGAGTVFIVVFCLLTVIGTWALSQSYLSQGALAQSQRAQHSERCLDLAEIATEEVVHYLRSFANDPTSPLFAFLREDVFPAQLSLPAEDLPKLQEVLSRLSGYGLRRSAEVTILRRAYGTLEAAERVNHEAFGVLRIDVAVSGPDGSRAHLKSEYGFRTNLMAPSRPYDQFTFFLGDPEVLLTRDAFESDANKTIEMALARLTSHRQALQKLADELEGKQGAETLQRIFADGAGPRYPTPDWTVAEAHAPTHETEYRLHYFAWPISLYSLEPEIRLEDVNLPAKVGPLVRTEADQQARIDAQVAAIRSLTQGGASASQAEAAAQQLVDLVLQEAATLRELLSVYKQFQDALVEIAGEARQELLLRSRNFAPLEQQYRASYRFEGAGAAGFAEKFLARRPIPSGVVFVQNGSDPLRVDLRDFSGRLFVVTEGDMEVLGATVKDPSKDLITLLSTGGLEIKGPTQACVVSWGGAFDTDGSSLRGALVLDALYPTSPLNDVLRGTLKRQDLIQTGPPGYPVRPPPDPTSILVTISPKPVYRRVDP